MNRAVASGQDLPAGAKRAAPTPTLRRRVMAAGPRFWLAMLAAIAGAALVAAFVLQWGFGVRPCILCLYERVPYAVVALAAGAGAVFLRSGRLQRRLLAACGGVFAVGAVLAGYHAGVEYHWWQSAVGCAVNELPTFNIKDLTQSAITPLKPCDEVDFRWLGLSLAGWNIVASSVLAAAAIVAAIRTHPGRGGN